MSKTTFVIAVLAGVTAGGAYVLPAAAQAPPPPIAAEPLTPRSVFVDDVGLKFIDISTEDKSRLASVLDDA